MTTIYPRYERRQRVCAFKIAAIEHNSKDHSVTIIPEREDLAPRVVSESFIYVHRPIPGGYHLIDETGYESFMSRGQFETFFTPAN